MSETLKNLTNNKLLAKIHQFQVPNMAKEKLITIPLLDEHIQGNIDQQQRQIETMLPPSEELRALLDDTSFQFEVTVDLQENLFHLALVASLLVSSPTMRNEALYGPKNERKSGVAKMYKARIYKDGVDSELIPGLLATHIHLQASETSIKALLKAIHSSVFSTVAEDVNNPEEIPTLERTNIHNENKELLQQLSSEVTLAAQEIIPAQPTLLSSRKPLYRLQFWCPILTKSCLNCPRTHH